MVPLGTTSGTRQKNVNDFVEVEKGFIFGVKIQRAHNERPTKKEADTIANDGKERKEC